MWQNDCTNGTKILFLPKTSSKLRKHTGPLELKLV